MVTHPTLQNASLRLRYLLYRFVEDLLNACVAALTVALAKQAMPWQKTATTLLHDNLDQKSSLLAPTLTELFATERALSA